MPCSCRRETIVPLRAAHYPQQTAASGGSPDAPPGRTIRRGIMTRCRADVRYAMRGENNTYAARLAVPARPRQAAANRSGFPAQFPPRAARNACTSSAVGSEGIAPCFVTVNAPTALA